MTQTHKYSFRGLALALIVTASAGLAPHNAAADERFQKWIADFYQTAAQNGISKATYQKAFAGVTEPDPTVLEKAAFQPEFTTKIWDYVDSRVNPYTVEIGRKMAAKHAATLNAIERHFGVDKSIILAIWSMESNYGAVLNKDDRLHYVPRALATLAYADRTPRQICQEAARRRAENPAERRHFRRWHDRLVGRCHGPYAVHPDKLSALRRRCRRQWSSRYLEFRSGCTCDLRQSSR